VPGGTAIPTPSGGTSGYTTSQASAALVTPDFVNVVGSLFAVPNRQQLNQALHSISAEPYASMQSVALEALEQFRANSIALNSSSKKLPFVVEEEVCRSESKTLKDSKTNSDCKPQKISRTTPWSLIFDGSNTHLVSRVPMNWLPLTTTSFQLSTAFNMTSTAIGALGLHLVTVRPTSTTTNTVTQQLTHPHIQAVSGVSIGHQMLGRSLAYLAI
jgi:hypothetical protein